MRTPGVALPFLLFLALVVYWLFGFVEIAAYRNAAENPPPNSVPEDRWTIYTGLVAASGDLQLAIRAGWRADLLSNTVNAVPYEGSPPVSELQTSAGPVRFDWTKARIVAPPRKLKLAGGEYTGFAAGDTATLLVRGSEGGLPKAEYVSGLMPPELINHRLRAGVRTLIAGVLLLGATFLMPQLIARFRGGWRIARLGPRLGRSAGRNACPSCGQSAALSLDKCAACGRPVGGAPQLKSIERALSGLEQTGFGSLRLQAGGKTLRLRWDASFWLEFRPGELSAGESLKTRRLLARLGFEPTRPPGALWRIDLGATAGRAAGLAHAILMDVHGLPADYQVKATRGG